MKLSYFSVSLRQYYLDQVQRACSQAAIQATIPNGQMYYKAILRLCQVPCRGLLRLGLPVNQAGLEGVEQVLVVG